MTEVQHAALDNYYSSFDGVAAFRDPVFLDAYLRIEKEIRENPTGRNDRVNAGIATLNQLFGNDLIGQEVIVEAATFYKVPWATVNNPKTANYPCDYIPRDSHDMQLSGQRFNFAGISIAHVNSAYTATFKLISPDFETEGDVHHYHVRFDDANALLFSEVPDIDEQKLPALLQNIQSDTFHKVSSDAFARLSPELRRQETVSYSREISKRLAPLIDRRTQLSINSPVFYSEEVHDEKAPPAITETHLLDQRPLDLSERNLVWGRLTNIAIARSLIHEPYFPTAHLVVHGHKGWNFAVPLDKDVHDVHIQTF